MENSCEAEQIASRLKLALPHLKYGSLRFWGVFSAGRPYEDARKITYCDARDEVLHIQFDCDESLYVWSPHQAELNRTVFSIQNAARVRWEWFSYRRPKTDQNLYFMDSRGLTMGSITKVTSTGARSSQRFRHRLPSSSLA